MKLLSSSDLTQYLLILGNHYELISQMNQLSCLISCTGRIKVGTQGKHAAATASLAHLIPRTRNVTRTRLISYVVLNKDVHLSMDLDPM